MAARALIAIATAALVTACSSVLGLKDPTLDEGGNPNDAAIDAPVDAAIDTGPAACRPADCPFGCDRSTNACRAEKLWVYLTTGSFLGNGFGGTDVPATVRETTDARCFETASAMHAARACNRMRTHAVLFVNGGDNIAGMATRYSIPVTAPVHRADDDVLVANTWNDLIDTRAPRAPVSTAATEAAGIVWTGANTTSHCTNWTSSADMGVNGVRGHTTLMVSTWMNRSSSACNLLARLLCVCWSGGE
jgi:hypothetical protein